MLPTRPFVLVVEDDVDTSETLVDLLLCEGFDAAAAPDAGLAWNRVLERRPDVILLDVHGTNGRQLATMLKESSSTAAIPIVVMSGLLLREDELLRRLASVVLVKPLDPEDLVYVLRTSASSCSAPTLRLP